MKWIHIIILISVILFSFFLWQKSQEEQIPIIVVKEYSVTGMTCSGCEETINSNVSKLEGVVSVNTSYLVGKTKVEYDSLSVSSASVKQIIEESGYEVVNIQPLKTVKENEEK